MATTYSTERTAERSSPIAVNPPQAAFGKVRIFTGTYTYASQAAGVIELCTIPKGFKIVSIQPLMSASHGGSATVAVGDSAVADKFRAAATLTTNAPLTMPLTSVVGATDATAIEGMDAPYTADTVIQITTAVAALPASGRCTWTITAAQD